MEVPKEKLKGKRLILRQFVPDTSDLNIPRIQYLMKKVNNCKASSWNCSSCPIGRLAKCFAKVRQHLQMEAMLEYKDRPEYRRQQEKIDREALYKNIKMR